MLLCHSKMFFRIGVSSCDIITTSLISPVLLLSLWETLKRKSLSRLFLRRHGRNAEHPLAGSSAATAAVPRVNWNVAALCKSQVCGDPFKLCNISVNTYPVREATTPPQTIIDPAATSLSTSGARQRRR